MTGKTGKTEKSSRNQKEKRKREHLDRSNAKKESKLKWIDPKRVHCVVGRGKYGLKLELTNLRAKVPMKTNEGKANKFAIIQALRGEKWREELTKQCSHCQWTHHWRELIRKYAQTQWQSSALSTLALVTLPGRTLDSSNAAVRGDKLTWVAFHCEISWERSKWVVWQQEVISTESNLLHAYLLSFFVLATGQGGPN